MEANTKDKHGIIGGSALIAVGAWAALAPSLVGGWTWDSEFTRFMLAIVPGTAAVIGGLLVLGRRARLVSLGGTVALIGGLWFIAAPLTHALFVGPQIGTADSGESVRVFQWAFFFFGSGAFISLVSSYMLGLLVPLEFGEELSPQAAAPATRARVQLPAERPRRQRGVTEPARRSRTGAKGSIQRDN
jgi:hypothetical protein